MCVIMGLALIAMPCRSVTASPAPLTGGYAYNKRSAADPELDLTTGLAAGFGGFGSPSTLSDLSYGSGFPANPSGFGFDDVTSGFDTTAALLHLSNPYAATTYGSGFNSIGYPFSDSTLNQLQFKTSLASGSPTPLQVIMTYNPTAASAGFHHTRISELPATESAQPTAQKTVPLQQTRLNDQRVIIESLNTAPTASAPLQQSYSAAASVPQQQSYPGVGAVPQQQSYVAAVSAPLQQSYPAAESVPQQQSYPGVGAVPRQQSYVAAVSTPLQQSYPATASAHLQQSYSDAASVPQQQSYPGVGAVPQQQSYVAAVSAPLQQSYPATASAPLQQSYSAAASVPQQQSYPGVGAVPRQQTYVAAVSAPLQQSYPATASAQLQQSYPATASAQLKQSYPATAEKYKIATYQPTVASSAADIPSQPSAVDFAPEAGSVPDLILELRPPPYSAPSPSVDNLQNINIPSTPTSSYPPADSKNKNNNYPRNDFGLSSTFGTSGLNQVSNGGRPLSEKTNDFFVVDSNVATPQISANTFYKVSSPVSGSSNIASSNVPNYYSVPSLSYSFTSTANRELIDSKNAHPATSVPSNKEIERDVPAVNPAGAPSLLYRDANPIISGVSYTSSNSISANSYSDTNPIQSSSYTTPGSLNPYNDYKLSAGNFNGDSNSISLNSKRESSTVKSSYKSPLRI